MLRAYARRRRDRDFPFLIAEGRTWLQLGFITLCQLVRRLQEEDTSISSALYHLVVDSIDEIVGAVAAEIMSYAHAHGEFDILVLSNVFILALSQEYPEPEDFQSLVRHLRDDLPLELVTFKNQFAAPYDRKPYSQEDYTICDENGLLCFLSTSYQHPVGYAEIFDHVDRMPRVHMFIIIFTHRIYVGPGAPFGFGVGPLVEYQVDFGHWVSLATYGSNS